jgi:hypothetical protein
VTPRNIGPTRLSVRFRLTVASVMTIATSAALAGCSGGATPTVAISGSGAAAGQQCCALPSSLAAAYNQLVGVVAIGHSGLTGYLTDSNNYTALQNSWATGTNPVVASIYQRLESVEPQIVGHVENAAIPGSRAVSLQQEAVDGFAVVPHPQLVIVQDVGNDIACDGTDAANYGTVAQEVRSALNTITSMSPRSKILVLGQLGTPAQKAKALTGSAAAKVALGGDGPCALFDSHGTLQPTDIARLASITDGYDEVFATACAQVAKCEYDDSSKVGFTYQAAELIPGDWNHLTIAGESRLAELMWPVVASELGL